MEKVRWLLLQREDGWGQSREDRSDSNPSTNSDSTMRFVAENDGTWCLESAEIVVHVQGHSDHSRPGEVQARLRPVSTAQLHL